MTRSKVSFASNGSFAFANGLITYGNEESTLEKVGAEKEPSYQAHAEEQRKGEKNGPKGGTQISQPGR